MILPDGIVAVSVVGVVSVLGASSVVIVSKIDIRKCTKKKVSNFHFNKIVILS